MAQKPKVFISHTTRDPRDHALAHSLATGLRKFGCEVWIGPDNVPVGSAWKREIVHAILSECSHFLVVVSAASTSAEWVLKEITLAKKRRANDASFTILPLIVGDTPPYSGRDFIDQFQRVPYRESFPAQLDTVVNSLHLRPDLPPRFSELIKDFVGRAYVFSAIEGFVNGSESGYFTIVGDPGEGKSAILAEFVRRTGCVAHFNRRADGVNRAEQCIRSITAQLSARFELSLRSPPSDPADYGQHWDELLRLVSSALDGGRVLIAVDALDEVDMSGHPSGANILVLPRLLPRGIYFVLTRRRLKIPFVVHSSQEVIDLVHYREESLVDIKTYIGRAMNRFELTAWMGRQNLVPSAFIEVLADKSERNFMYLRYVLPEIERGAYESLEIEQLPHGLRAYYEDHWERMGMRADPLPRDKIRIVYVMAEVRRPVSRSLVADFTDQDPILVQNVIDEWQQFLHKQLVDGETRYSVYHSSFLDFLHDEEVVKAAGETIENINKHIASSLRNEWMKNA